MKAQPGRHEHWAPTGPEPRALITGSGRSGSGYIAQVLNHAGIPCGHENWWNPHGVSTAGLLVDSSWCALAIGLDDYQGAVFHQVRHPLASIASFVNHEPPPGNPYRELRLRIMADSDDPMTFGMAAWLSAVETAERYAQRTWRLDDVDAALIVDIAAVVGVDVSETKAQEAIGVVPCDYNWHGEGRRLGWDDLPAGDTKDRICGWAEQWGWM